MFLIKILLLSLIVGLNPVEVIAGDAFSADTRYLYVQKGQTLHNIVKRLYPNRAKDWPKITDSIVRQNSHAFTNGDPTKMKADVRLKLPQMAVVRAVPLVPKSQKNVGVVVESHGSVVVVSDNKAPRDLTVGSLVYIGDKVITGEHGEVRLQMVDNAILDIRCFSIMVIEDYAIDPSNRRSILNLLQGSLKKITGNIGQLTDDVYELKTPVASVGVRGTEYALRVFQSEGCGGTVNADDGLYLEVIKGLVDVRNKIGKAVAAKGDTIYVALPDSAPKKEAIKPGVIEPLTANHSNNEESSNLWWWLLGVVAIALLI